MISRNGVLARPYAWARERLTSVEPSGGVRVLTYHGVVASKSDPYLERNFHTIDQFRVHLRFLRKCVVIPPASVVGSPADSRRHLVAITFDDGFRNNEIAAELLEEERMPWALFVSTGVVGSASTVWTARLGLLLLHGHAHEIEAFGRSWSLLEREDRLAAFAAIRRRAKLLSSRQRVAFLESLTSQFDIAEEERLLSEFPSFQMMTWEGLRELSTRGVTVGSHGVTHELLHGGQPDEVVRWELNHSQQQLSKELQTRCDTLAYPNGDCSSYSRHVARSLGFRAAFTTLDGSVEPDSDPMALPRMTALGDPIAFLRSLQRGRCSI